MELIQQVPELSAYLAADEAIDHEHPLVRETVAELRRNAADAYAYASVAYAFVRDTIVHSADSGDMRVAWRASDVLATRTASVMPSPTPWPPSCARRASRPPSATRRSSATTGAPPPCTG